MKHNRRIEADKNKFYRDLDIDSKLRKLISFFNEWKREAQKEEK